MPSSASLLRVFALGLGCVLLLVGCGKKAPTTADAKPAAGTPDMEADLARTVREQSSFYQFKTPADLPTSGLTWINGSDLPEFADLNAKKGGTFNYYIPDFPRTLRAYGPDATGGIREYLLDWVSMQFMHPHPNIPDKLFPGLAKEWAVDLPNKTVYIRIDPAARWSDGVPVTTADVVFTLYFMRSPFLNEPWNNDFYTTKYQKLTIYDDHTFALTMTDRKPDMDSYAGSITPYPRHAFKDFGPGWEERFQWRVIPTSGAYTILDKDIERGRAITLTRLNNWWAKDLPFWRGRYNPDKVRLEVIRDPDKTAEAFLHGDLDLFRIATPKFWYETIPDDHPAVKAGYITKIQFYNQIPCPDWGVWINRAKPGLDDLNVRLGIQYATNFDLVCTQFYRGDAVREETRSDGYPFTAYPDVKARHFNPDTAREYFAKAGYTQQGPDGVLRNAAGKRLSFTLTTYRQDMRDLMAILKQEALKAGLEYNLEILDQTTGWKKVQEKNHEVTLIALSRQVESYPRYWDFYHGSNAYEDAYLDEAGKPVDKFSQGKPNPHPQKVKVQTNNMTMTFIPHLDELIEAYDKAETMDEIKRLSKEIEHIVSDDAAWVNGWKEPYIRSAYQSYIKWPKDYNVAQARYLQEFFLMWIDQDEKKAVEEARRSGRTFPPQIIKAEKFRQQ